MTLTARTFVSLLLLATAATAQDFGPDTCVQGFVWREAFPGDHVCVDPSVRSATASDNQLAARRRQPGGGAYGPDTCRAGFVWREARPEDHVCVTPDVRTQAANDNRAAAGRVARARGRLSAGAISRAGIDRVQVPTAVVRPPAIGTAPPRPESGSASKRGFDDQGNPYIEDVLPDGSRRREQRNGVTVIKPDGTSQFIPYSFTRANAPAPTPPQLPSSDMGWVNYHNQQLLNLITTIVKGDTAQIDLFHQGENRSVGSDPFKQIGYRMQVLNDLAKP